MSNNLTLVLTVVFCFICFGLSFLYRLKEQYPAAILLMMLGGVAIRFYVSADFILHPWDEQFHALVAKHLMTHPLTPTLIERPVMPYDYRNWGGNHIWLHKQPLALWAIAASMSIFGANVIAVRLPSMLLSTIGIWLTFYIGSYLFDKRRGYLAAFLFCINGFIIEITGGRSGSDHVDVFFMFFIELAIFFTVVFVRRGHVIYTIFAGLSLGLAILSKWIPALIVLPIWLLIVIDSGRLKPGAIIGHLVLLMAAAMLTAMPWQIYIRHAFPMEAAWETSFNSRHFGEALEGHTGTYRYYLDEIAVIYGPLIYLPILWFMWRTFRNIRDLRRMALCIWLVVPVVFFTLAATKMDGYILFVFPSIFLITADCCYTLASYRNDPVVKWVVWLLILMLLWPSVAFAYEKMTRFDDRGRKPAWVADLKKLNGHYKDGVLFNYNEAVCGMFYTDLTVYIGMPDLKTVSDLISRGYTVLINDDGHIPPAVAAVPGVITVHLMRAEIW